MLDCGNGIIIQPLIILQTLASNIHLNPLFFPYSADFNLVAIKYIFGLAALLLSGTYLLCKVSLIFSSSTILTFIVKCVKC